MGTIFKAIKSAWRDIKATKRRNSLLSYIIPYRFFMRIHPMDTHKLSDQEKAVYDAEQEIHSQQLRMYILVRRDILPLVHCGVQAAHAAAEYVQYHQCHNTEKWATKDKTMIVLSATHSEIEFIKLEFARDGLHYQPFHEPDMSNMQTAVAFQPITIDIGQKYFKNLKLLA